MRVIKTHVPASIITAEGGHWHCVQATINGEPVEIWAPIYSPAAALQRLTEAVVLPAMRADEGARQHDYAQGYDVAVKAIGEREQAGNAVHGFSTPSTRMFPPRSAG